MIKLGKSFALYHPNFDSLVNMHHLDCQLLVCVWLCHEKVVLLSIHLVNHVLGGASTMHYVS